MGSNNLKLTKENAKRVPIQSAIQAKKPTQMHFGGYMLQDKYKDEAINVSQTMSVHGSYDDFSNA